MYLLKWIVVCGLYALLAACGGDEPSTPKPSGIVSVPGLEGVYKIERDEYSAPWKRTVEVTLYKELTEAELAAMAESIKAAAKTPTERTFIGYWYMGFTDAGYWATTHYNPEMEITFPSRCC